MSLAPNYLNNIGSTKKKPSKKQMEAKKQHDEWLLKKGVHPSQLKGKVKNKAPSYKEKTPVELSNSIAPGGLKRGIFEEMRNEAPDVQLEIRKKAAACAPAYSKGGIQYLGTDKSVWLDAGKKK